MPVLFKDELGEKYSDMLIEHIMNSGDFKNRVMLQSIFLFKDNIKYQKQIDNYYNQVIKVTTEFEDDESLATSFYNYGNVHKNRGNYFEAIKY